MFLLSTSHFSSSAAAYSLQPTSQKEKEKVKARVTFFTCHVSCWRNGLLLSAININCKNT